MPSPQLDPIACLKAQTLTRWRDKIASDGPQPVIGLSPDASRKLSTARHTARLAWCDAQIEHIWQAARVAA